jgi:hypothetical protein
LDEVALAAKGTGYEGELLELQRRYPGLFQNTHTAQAAEIHGKYMDDMNKFTYPGGTVGEDSLTTFKKRVELVDKLGGPSEAWKTFGISPSPPTFLDKMDKNEAVRTLYNYLWDQHIRPSQTALYNKAMHAVANDAKLFMPELVKISEQFGHNIVSPKSRR